MKKMKKILCRKIWNGLLPICIARKKNCIAGSKAKLYCKRKPLHCIVAGLRVFILQYTVLYCRKKKSVYCNGYCIARGLQEGLCHNTVHCIVTEARHGLYCNTVTVPTTQGDGRAWGAGLGIRRRGRAAGAGVGAGACAGRANGQALGVQGRAKRRACGKQAAGAGHRRGRVRGARGRSAAGRGRARQARGLATGCALSALGLFSVRFDLVFFPSQFLDIVREPGS